MGGGGFKSCTGPKTTEDLKMVQLQVIASLGSDVKPRLIYLPRSLIKKVIDRKEKGT